MFGSNEMANEGEGVLQFTNDSIFIFLMWVMITCRDVGATHTDAVERQGKDVAALSRSDRKLRIEN